jgi:hypothetical protein
MTDEGFVGDFQGLLAARLVPAGDQKALAGELGHDLSGLLVELVQRDAAARVPRPLHCVHQVQKHPAQLLFLLRALFVHRTPDLFGPLGHGPLDGVLQAIGQGSVRERAWPQKSPRRVSTRLSGALAGNQVPAVEKNVEGHGRDRAAAALYWSKLRVETHKARAVRRERLRLEAREWKDRWGLARLRGLARGSSLFGFRALAAPSSLEQRYRRRSRARAAVQVALLAAVLATDGIYRAKAHGQPFSISFLHLIVLALARPASSDRTCRRRSPSPGAGEATHKRLETGPRKP